jgi:hypothetical protein
LLAILDEDDESDDEEEAAASESYTGYTRIIPGADESSELEELLLLAILEEDDESDEMIGAAERS